MLPVRLTLKNFLAYRSPESLSFEGIDVACLSGPNGAGKSSLLDAITWALWGQARADADELIHLGQDEMQVTFDFRQDQQLYRVIRKRSKRGRGKTELDLLMPDETTQQFTKVISESTIRETQARIDHLLKLDYETFTNSAFLQQGKADAFTVKTPGERKRILADILGLSRWDTYEEQAKKSLQAITTQISILNGAIIEKEREENQEAALLTKLEEAAQRLTAARQAREVAEQQFGEVSGAPAAKQAAQAQLAAAQRREKQRRQEQATLASELQEQRRRLDSYTQIIEMQQQIEDGYTQLQQARDTNDELSDKLQQWHDAELRLHDLQRQLDAARADLNSQASVYQDRVHKAEQDIAQHGKLAAELASVQSDLQALAQRGAERDSIVAQKQGLSEESATTKTRNEALRIEMNDIKGRLTIIQSSHEALCPVCRQPLDKPHRDELTEQYRSEGKARGDTFRTNEARLKEITDTVAAHDATLRQIELDLRHFDSMKAREARLLERSSVIEKAEQKRAAEQQALDAVLQILNDDNFSPELRARITELSSQIDSLGYDKDIHSEAREALKTLRAFETQKHELDMALQLLPDALRTVEELTERYQRASDQLAEAVTEVADLQQQIREWAVLEQEAQRRFAELRDRRADERDAESDENSVRQQIAAIDAARRRKHELVKQRDELCEDEAICQQLKEAFGRNGIPAMIIEAALPELEDATNKLLTRMTDGRMHIRFDTQREKKSGPGVIETLDIQISDELGTRGYDMFSGGEGFRVNFALRIALSQFLARRAGARLQTLVIDEGFGSQDEVGRERLVEAINAVRADFDLILIVTHIDDLRDQFPTHIEINKTPTGSQITVR